MWDTVAHGKKILVHCRQGVSRSSTIVINYLLWRQYTLYNPSNILLKVINELNENMHIITLTQIETCHRNLARAIYKFRRLSRNEYVYDEILDLHN